MNVAIYQFKENNPSPTKLKSTKINYNKWGSRKWFTSGSKVSDQSMTLARIAKQMKTRIMNKPYCNKNNQMWIKKRGSADMKAGTGKQQKS